jgi:hypothetical protein
MPVVGLLELRVVGHVGYVLAYKMLGVMGTSLSRQGGDVEEYARCATLAYRPGINVSVSWEPKMAALDRVYLRSTLDGRDWVNDRRE